MIYSIVYLQQVLVNVTQGATEKKSYKLRKTPRHIKHIKKFLVKTVYLEFPEPGCGLAFGCITGILL